MEEAKPISYEEIRQQRLAENKKRMEELNLTMLAQAVRSRKPLSMKPRTLSKETTCIQVRRSSRLIDKPTPIYKEVGHSLLSPLQASRSSCFTDMPTPDYNKVPIDFLERPRRYSTRGRDLSKHVYEARVNAIERAKELESKLENGFPSFVKPMLEAHVTDGFWLDLPNHFCKKNLLTCDGTITLVDEGGDEWPTIYEAHRARLSGGWEEFSLDHDLVHGDVLVFELVKLEEFKVYIIKVDAFQKKYIPVPESEKALVKEE